MTEDLPKGKGLPVYYNSMDFNAVQVTRDVDP